MKNNGNADDPMGRIIDLQLGGQWERITQKVMRVSPQNKLSDIFPRQGKPSDGDLLSGKPPQDKPVIVFHAPLGESDLGSIAGEGEFVRARCFYNPQEPSNAKIYDSDHYDQNFLKRLVPEVSKVHCSIPTEFEKFELNGETSGAWWQLSWSSLKGDMKHRGRIQIWKHDWLENLFIGAIDRKYYPTLDKKKSREIKVREIGMEMNFTEQEKRVVTLMHHGLNRGDVSELLGKSKHSVDQAVYRLKRKGLKV